MHACLVLVILKSDILFYALFSSDVVVLPTIAMKTLNRKVKILGNTIR